MCAYAVSGLTITRKGATMTATWTVPSGATNTNNKNRATNTEIDVWQHDSYKPKSSGGICKYQYKVLALSTKTYSVSLVKGCRTIEFYIFLYNKEGAKKDVTKYVKLYGPYNPTISAFTYTPTDGHKLKAVVTARKAILDRPRSAIYITVFREAMINGKAIKSTTIFEKPEALGWDSSDTITYTWQISNAEYTALIKETDFIHYRIKARAMSPLGLHSEVVSRDFYIAYPAVPTITRLSYVSSGVTVSINDNYSEKRPTEKLQVEVAFATKEPAKDATDWKPVGSEYTRPCKGITIDNDDLVADVGKHVYLRVKATAQERPLYSAVVKLDDKKYFTSEAGDKDAPIKDIQVESVTSGDDNKSLNVVVGYADLTSKLGKVYDGTEISYSTDMYAWKSTSAPCRRPFPAYTLARLARVRVPCR